MMAPGHMAHGALFGLSLAPLAPHPGGLLVSTVALTVLGVVGALVPDLDHHSSKLTRSLGPITMVLSFVLVRLSKAVYMATRTTKDPVSTNGHRALTHTPVFAVVLGTGTGVAVAQTPAHAYAVLVGAGLAMGCIAHLCGDSCTNSGVPWLWPLVVNGRRWGHYGIPKALRFDTGGPVGEPLMTLATIVLCVAVPVGYGVLGWGV